MKKILLAALASASIFVGKTNAQSYNPFGPQHDILVSTITSGGWTQCYAGSMSAAIGEDASGVLNSCTGTKLMMGGRLTGSSTILLLAAGARDSITTLTGVGSNGTISVQGSTWYFGHDYSWGFAQLGASVNLNTCDVLAGADRMCLHTENGIGGYRIGDVAGLNSSSAYEKVFYQYNGAVVTVTPEPASFALVGIGMLAVGVARRRRSRQA